MNSPTPHVPAFAEARKLQAAGRLQEAERTYRALAASAEHRELALRELADLYARAGRAGDAVAALVALTEQLPDKLHYYAMLAGLMENLGQPEAAIGHYQRLLHRQPRHATAHYNLALLYKKAKRFEEARLSYQHAIECGIDRLEDVYSNMGVLYSEMRRPEEARNMYEQALALEPEYVPALYNLAGLLEETGAKNEAIALYERILRIDPRHWDSLARLTHATRLAAGNAGFVQRLKQGIEAASGDAAGRETLQFALGKALDDLGRYEEAFAAYRAANELGRARLPAYDRRVVEGAIDKLIATFSKDRLEHGATAHTARPVFICGMFRSGSTLIEQVLACHPGVTAGGELEYLALLIRRHLLPFPERAAGVSREQLAELGQEYLAMLDSLFPGAGLVTDKRPDNFLHLGLIKSLFPGARIIYTKRNPLDTCLSVYFQQLGGNLNYSADLSDTAHYYRQHQRLMDHWQRCFPGSILTVDYDELVQTPEPVIRRLLEFLDLEWDERCLRFEEAASPVKTASIWQVREGLYRRSSGRWKHYSPWLGALTREFGEGDAGA